MRCQRAHAGSGRRGATPSKMSPAPQPIAISLVKPALRRLRDGAVVGVFDGELQQDLLGAPVTAAALKQVDSSAKEILPEFKPVRVLRC